MDDRNGVVAHVVTSSIITQWDGELLLRILNNVYDAVLVIDSDTLFVYLNDAYPRVLGVSIEIEIWHISCMLGY